MTRAFPPLVLALLGMGLLSACAEASPPTSKAFAWHRQDGTSRSFSEVLPRKASGGNRLGPATPARTYLLAAPLQSASPLGLELSLKPGPLAAPGSAAPGGAATGAVVLEVGLSPRRDGAEAFATSRFTLPGEAVRMVIPLPAGRKLLSLRVSLVTEGGKASSTARSVEDGAYLSELMEIREVPAWSGFDLGPEGLRLSPGVSVFRKGGETHVHLEAPLSLEGLDPKAYRGMSPGLLVRYGPGASGRSGRIVPTSGPALVLKLRPAGLTTVLAPGSAELGGGSLDLVLPSGVEALGFAAGYLPSDLAELADFGRVLRSPPDPRADYALYRWDLLPSVLLFDFRDYATQDRYLKRLAFFVEKLGFKGRLATNEELAPLHGWNAHDYRAEDLAAFFEAARAKGFALNPEEKALGDLLVARGILRKEGAAFAPGAGALISITRESAGYLRTLFLTHESTHGIFFADAAYRDFVRATWKAMDREEKWYWFLFLGWKGYDVDNPYLMANEYQAYLLQQPLPLAEDYFTKNQPAQILEKHPELKPELEAYFAKYPGAFLRRATELDAWIGAKYGFQAGKGGSY